MSNFKILLLQELAGQIKTFIFWVMIPTAFTISFLVSNLQIMSFKDRQTVFWEQETKSREALQNVYFYSQLKVEAFIPPSVLSVFSLGLDESIGNKITVSILDQPALQNTSQRGNAFIKIFNNLDITGIIKILSIFIVLMAACSLVQDKEQHMGKLIFANSVGRLEYLLSKFVALSIIVFIMVFIIFIIPLIWISLDPEIHITFSSFSSIILMMLSSVLYLSIFVLISMAISAINSKMAIATLSSLMVWVFLGFIYPFTANSVIDRLVTVTSDNAVTKEIEQVDRDITLENVRFLKDNDAFVNQSWCSMQMSHILGLITEYNTAPKSYFEKAKTALDFILPNWWERIERVKEIKGNQKKQLLYKKTLYDQVAFFVPDRIYQDLCEKIAGTDYNFREKRFTEAVSNYRLTLMDYIQKKGGFGYAFFTQVPESMMLDNYEDYPADFEKRFCEDMMLLNISDMPQFSIPSRSKEIMPWSGSILMVLAVGFLSLSICYRYLSFK